MIYVIAGNFGEYQNFRQYNYQYLGGGYAECRYVDNVNALRGLRPDTQFATYGSWRERSDVNEIHDTIHYILNQQTHKELKIW